MLPERRAAEAAMMARKAPEVDRRLNEMMKASPTAAWALSHGMLDLR
jgi:hypothetical protein